MLINVEWTTFDKHNDVALLDNLKVAMQDGMGNRFGGVPLKPQKRDLEKLNIAHFDDKPGHQCNGQLYATIDASGRRYPATGGAD